MSEIRQAIALLKRAGVCDDENPSREGLVVRAMELLRQRSDPDTLMIEVLKADARAERNRQRCGQAAEAAKKLEDLVEALANGHASLYRLDSFHRLPSGAIAICRASGQVRELPVHPCVDLDRLESVSPWEYVRVRDDVVVGVVTDTPGLWRAAHGEIVDFREYADTDRQLARVTRHGGVEEVVELAQPLLQAELGPDTKLVLHRDQPRWAIGVLPRQASRGRFEVPVNNIRTTFEDLAGMDRVVERLVMDVLKRFVYRDVRETYDLEPLRGMLLISKKPGMGKTSLVRAFARFLSDWGEKLGFDVVLHLVPPNATKSMWHGEDARIMREDIFAAIRARAEQPRERPLFQLLVMDEIDSLGRRPAAGDVVTSAAQADALESLLTELDGFVELPKQNHESHLLVIGMSNRPDRIDDAMKRPGRMGDLILELDNLDQSAAESICAVYARHGRTPWQLNGKAICGPPAEDVIARMIRPAVAAIFPLVVCHYFDEQQRQYDVSAGEIMAGAHYREAMNKAKNRAAERKLLAWGNPAVTYDDVIGSLLETATVQAGQMASDPRMLMRQLDIKLPVVRVQAVPKAELEMHRFVRVQA